MELFRILASRCGAMFHPKKLDADLDEEVRSHLELALEDNIRHGMDREQARVTALRKFGGVTQTKEKYRTQRGLAALRMALVARRADIFRVVLASAGTTVGLGVGVGLLLTLGARPVLFHWIDCSTMKPLTIVAVTLLFLAVSALAYLIPAGGPHRSIQ